MTEPNAPEQDPARDEIARKADELVQPSDGATDNTPAELKAAALGLLPADEVNSAPDEDDTDSDDGPDEGTEQVDPENVPAGMALPDEIHAGDEDKAGDELAGDDEDDGWLDEEDEEE